MNENNRAKHAPHRRPTQTRTETRKGASGWVKTETKALQGSGESQCVSPKAARQMSKQTNKTHDPQYESTRNANQKTRSEKPETRCAKAAPLAAPEMKASNPQHAQLAAVAPSHLEDHIRGKADGRPSLCPYSPPLPLSAEACLPFHRNRASCHREAAPTAASTS
eukprot:7384818-Prymnesium_polylepis.5